MSYEMERRSDAERLGENRAAGQHHRGIACRAAADQGPADEAGATEGSEMIFKLSNTGKTITVKPLEALPGDRFKIDISNRHVRFSYIEPGNVGGLVVSPNGCISMESSRIPSWPLHGKIEVMAEQYADGTYVATLPAVLKPPKVVSARQPKSCRKLDSPSSAAPFPPRHAIPLTSSVTPVTMQVGARTYSFNLPQETLIDTILAWSEMK